MGGPSGSGVQLWGPARTPEPPCLRSHISQSSRGIEPPSPGFPRNFSQNFLSTSPPPPPPNSYLIQTCPQTWGMVFLKSSTVSKLSTFLTLLLLLSPPGRRCHAPNFSEEALHFLSLMWTDQSTPSVTSRQALPPSHSTTSLLLRSILTTSLFL